MPNGDRGPLGPPPTPFQFGRRGGIPRFGRALPFIVAAAVLIILFIIASVAKDLYADLLWFDSVGYRSVYTTRIVTSAHPADQQEPAGASSCPECSTGVGRPERCLGTSRPAGVTRLIARSTL